MSGAIYCFLRRCFFIAIAASATFRPANAQVIACSVMQGNWEYYATGDQYDLTQDASGNITGTDTSPTCPDVSFPITGTVTPGQFTFTVTGMYGQCGSYVQWVTFTGYVSQPGCNYAYGTWSNSIPNGGAFGQDDPYPPVGSSAIFTKEVDVPSGETTQIPPPAAWSTTKGAPWNQSLSPNSPSGEYEARGVYEYGNGQGTDTCWFQGSKYKQFVTVSTPGFGWEVTSRNTWGADWIGWTLAAVDYYRAQSRVPCGASFPQLLVIDAAYSPNNPPTYLSYLNQQNQLFYGVAYETNNLNGNITATSVTSSRNSDTSTNTSWK